MANSLSEAECILIQKVLTMAKDMITEEVGEDVGVPELLAIAAAIVDRAYYIEAVAYSDETENGEADEADDDEGDDE